jgi:hypothetical protein
MPADTRMRNPVLPEMSASDYILLAAALLGAALALSLAASRPELPPLRPPEATRWRRFRVFARPLHADLERPAVALAEEPGGLRLDALPRPGLGERIDLAEPGGRRRIAIARGWFPFLRRLRVKLDGKPLAKVLVSGRQRQVSLVFDFPAQAVEVHGDIPGREYEMRRRKRIIALASRFEDLEAHDPEEYLLEVLKDEDPLPVIAVALAAEAAVGAGGIGAPVAR